MHDELRALIDRLAIEDTLVRYANAIDTHEPQRFAEVFAEDARVDYTAAGGVAGSWRELLEWLRGAMAPFSAWQHLLSNIVVEIDGDFARARTECYNPLARADGSVLHVGCHYLDRLRRDPAGWRIVERRLGVTWMDERPRAG